ECALAARTHFHSASPVAAGAPHHAGKIPKLLTRHGEAVRSRAGVEPGRVLGVVSHGEIRPAVVIATGESTGVHIGDNRLEWIATVEGVDAESGATIGAKDTFVGHARAIRQSHEKTNLQAAQLKIRSQSRVT